MMNLETLIHKAPKFVDLTNDSQAKDLIQRKDDTLTFVLLANKLAQSKRMLESVDMPWHFSVVFAMYKEHQRILKSSEHPHGEDFLSKKIAQLEWLFEGRKDITWHVVAVDDGCPESSGKIAQGIIDANGWQDKAKVLFLSDAIQQGYAPAQGLSATKDSQKGGSILYGMWDAVQHQNNSNHIVVFTDADLSTHLGQLMLLVNPIITQGQLAGIGSRREQTSVVVKQGSRNDRGKLFIYLWKRMLPNLSDIIDTQCGFKAFRADIVEYLTQGNIEKKFAFDVELLLKIALRKAGAISKVPIAWIDSEAASTTTDLQPYLPMLQSIAAMQKKYLAKGKNDFVNFVESLTEDDFNRLLQNIPQDISGREPDAFAEYDKVSVEMLRDVLDKR